MSTPLSRVKIGESRLTFPVPLLGIKVLYNNVLMDLFSAPPLNTKKGKILWAIIVPIWWSIAFVVAGAIPAYFSFVSIISSLCLIQVCSCLFSTYFCAIETSLTFTDSSPTRSRPY